MSVRKKEVCWDDLTDHDGDMDYEYWALINNYATLLSQDFEKEKKAEQTDSH